ncbi:hypothetical protein [Sphaerisporangium sp. TRM90804]|uniref:hypothetical protein n=1 Tax=Sphaerisporangium sp. TRM90804 TaxID=3031113 RepID=UPI00244B287B|nr:hypothetical protein [Sphaerisporangium sp. TRM90804]MDH2429209.1 hypothetical protein [Sphaerisporangium sp. TRM90804]
MTKLIAPGPRTAPGLTYPGRTSHRRERPRPMDGLAGTLGPGRRGRTSPQSGRG